VAQYPEKNCAASNQLTRYLALDLPPMLLARRRGDEWPA
jgi:hypothetical protein